MVVGEDNVTITMENEMAVVAFSVGIDASIKKNIVIVRLLGKGSIFGLWRCGSLREMPRL